MELLKNSLAELTAVVHIAPNQHVEDHINKVVDEWPVPVVLIPGGSPHIKYDAFAVRPLDLSIHLFLSAC